MIVFDLRCSNAHVFEAWFGSSADYDGQAARGLVACPICDDAHVTKAMMAPAIPTKGNRRTSSPLPSADEPVAAVSAPDMKSLFKELADQQSKIEAASDYVGAKFADVLHRHSEESCFVLCTFDSVACTIIGGRPRQFSRVIRNRQCLATHLERLRLDQRFLVHDAVFHEPTA